MEELVSELATKKIDRSLTMKTQDAEMQEFVSRLKRKKSRNWMLVGIAAAAVAVAVILLVVLFR